ncbi:MAG: hypothetical protein ACRELS_20230 [Candidatus Rokuibacteriota bacterium]
MKPLTMILLAWVLYAHAEGGQWVSVSQFNTEAECTGAKDRIEAIRGRSGILCQ